MREGSRRGLHFLNMAHAARTLSLPLFGVGLKRTGRRRARGRGDMRPMPRCAGTGRKTRSGPSSSGCRLDSIGPKCAESSPLTMDQNLSTERIPACLDSMYGMLFWDCRGPCCYYARISFLLSGTFFFLLARTKQLCSWDDYA